MPFLVGTETKSLFHKLEAHKLFEEREVGPLKATITFDADLIAANTIDGNINGVGITTVTYASSHDNTMDLLAAEVLSNPDVGAVALTDASDNRQLTIYAADVNGALVLASWAVTNGTAQAGTVAATDTNDVKAGQMVQLQGDGTVEPVINGDYRFGSMGISMHDGTGGELVTVMMKAYAIVWMECGTNGLLAGPVKIHSTVFNATTGYQEVDDASVTAANMVGWALDGGDDGDLIRVAITP